MPLAESCTPLPNDSLILSAPEGPYLDAYLDDELYLENPLFDWIANNDGAVRMSDLLSSFTGNITPGMIQRMKLRHEHAAGRWLPDQLSRSGAGHRGRSVSECAG